MYPKKNVLALAMSTYCLSHEQVKIGGNVSTLDFSSILELESTTKALVLTRISNAEMTVILALNGAFLYNTDTSTNLNVNSVITSIFGTEDYLDDGITLYEVSGNTLAVKKFGKYNSSANLSFQSISISRNSPSTRITVNGLVIGVRVANGYIRSNGHFKSSIYSNEILQLNANSGTVKFNASGEANYDSKNLWIDYTKIYI